MLGKIAMISALAFGCFGCSTVPASVAAPVKPKTARPVYALPRTDHDLSDPTAGRIKVLGAFDMVDGKLRAWDMEGRASTSLAYAVQQYVSQHHSLEGKRAIVYASSRSLNGESVFSGRQAVKWNLRYPIEGVFILPMTKDAASGTGCVRLEYSTTELSRETVHGQKGIARTMGSTPTMTGGPQSNSIQDYKFEEEGLERRPSIEVTATGKQAMIEPKVSSTDLVSPPAERDSTRQGITISFEAVIRFGIPFEPKT